MNSKYLQLVQYYNIINDFSNFKEKILNVEGVLNVEKKINKEKYGDNPRINISVCNSFTGDVRIVSITPSRHGCGIELLDENFENLAGNSYDETILRNMGNILTNYRTSFELFFDVTIDIASFYNPDSNYKFYHNDKYIVMSDKKYIYKFVSGKIENVFKQSGNDFYVIDEKINTSEVEQMYHNYTEYLSNDDVMVYENDAYINILDFAKSVRYSDKYSWFDISKVAIFGLYFGFTIIGLVFLLDKNVTFTFKESVILLLCLVLPALISYEVGKPFREFEEIYPIKQDYESINSKNILKLNKYFDVWDLDDVPLNGNVSNGKVSY